MNFKSTLDMGDAPFAFFMWYKVFMPRWRFKFFANPSDHFQIFVLFFLKLGINGFMNRSKTFKNL